MGSSSTVRVAGIVLKWIRGDKQQNYDRFEAMARQAAAEGADLICSTECFLDGYAITDKSIPADRYYAMGEKIPGGEYYNKLANLAKELGVFLAAGIHEIDGPTQYNAAVLIDSQGQLAGKYHKHKLGHEDMRHTPGNDYPSFATSFGTVGMMICADRSRPVLLQGLCDNGADVIICLSGGAFGPRNDFAMKNSAQVFGRYIVFVHPTQFLVTAPDGSISKNHMLGDLSLPKGIRYAQLSVLPDEIGTDTDRSGVFSFDLPMG